jgi:multidrug efflux pump subunit AcrA (membrane-fusion protein)
MSAIHGLSPAPLRAPEPLITAAPPSTPKKPSSLRTWVLLALIVGGAGAVYQFIAKPKAQSRAVQSTAIRTAKVTSGPIQRILRLTGSTSAKNFASVAAPMMRGPDAGRALVLIHVANSGAMVKKGEVVAKIDAQAMIDHVDDLSATIDQADADIRRRKAEQAMNWENLQQDIRVAKANLEKAKLDLSASEVRTPVDAEILKLAAEEAEATYKEKLTDLPVQKISFGAELRILELTKERHVRHRDRHKYDVERFTIQAPIDGLVVMQSIWRGTEMGQIQTGDQIAPGQSFMKVVDTSRMQMEGVVSQVESDEMRLGEPAVITFDAFPGLKLKAKVSTLGAIATGGWWSNYYLRTVRVYLSILDHDNRVIPDLSTAASVAVNETANALLIPREAVETKDGKSFVRVKAGDGYETREVKLGMSDNIHVAVLKGVHAGDEVALDQPQAGPVLASAL